LEAERKQVPWGREADEVPHRRHPFLRMRDHYRGIAVVRVQDLEVRRRGPDPLEKRPDRGPVDPRRRRGSEADRLVAEEVRLAPEAEVHRPELRETPD